MSVCVYVVNNFLTLVLSALCFEKAFTSVCYRITIDLKVVINGWYPIYGWA